MMWRRYALGLEQWFADTDRAAWEAIAEELPADERSSFLERLKLTPIKKGTKSKVAEGVFDMIDTGTAGAANYLGKAAEHLVCVRLLGWGIQAKVMSGTSAFDIAAILPGQAGTLRIQVKSKIAELDQEARFDVTRKLTDPITKKSQRVPYDSDDIDVVALVSLPLLAVAFRVAGGTSYTVPLSELTDRLAAKRSFDAAITEWQKNALQLHQGIAEAPALPIRLGA